MFNIMIELSWQLVVLILGVLGIICWYANTRLKILTSIHSISNNPQQSLMGTLQPGIENKAMQDYKERTSSLQKNTIIEEINRCLHWDITQKDFYFISYSSRNVMQAETLKRLLQDKNIHVWIAPDGIPQGREYPLVIPTALKLAKTFVLLLTPDSAKSQWVRRELAMAISNSVETKVKVILSDGFTVSDMRRDNELEFLLDRVQIKYEYSDLIRSSDMLYSFISE